MYCAVHLSSQIYDVSDMSVLPCAFAEVCVLQHLTGWQGSVQLIDYGRERDEVRRGQAMNSAREAPGQAPYGRRAKTTCVAGLLDDG